ncbi:hypothetical protein QLQ15_17790 [Lysobacter sp. LF1]|uniref:Uncharacterized protein n=1 Tax=Lysobacter stagni TaxID=3045172 RepID=A0ABT6XKS1_9GAMM|nr:hypothetical protein [Lysobacter sp. LF1]MDI9240759.1 hypothetical protein [Lysobacter sp. LF1]
MNAPERNEEPRCHWCGKRQPTLTTGEIRVRTGDEPPAVDGFYVVWLLGSSIPRVLSWRHEWSEWRAGDCCVTVDRYFGPLPN